MDLPASLGQHHCSFASCQTLDFLPLECAYCSAFYCTDHAVPPLRHKCSKDPELVRVEGSRFENAFVDLLPDRSINPVVAQRSEEDDTRKRKREEAIALIEKNFGSKVRSTASGSEKEMEIGILPKAKPALAKKKKNAVIELMKLKQRAKQGNPTKNLGEVPMESRIYLIAMLVESEGWEETDRIRELWFPKSTTLGKTLDLLAVHFKLENSNNVTSNDASKLLSLYYPTSNGDRPTKVDNSQKLDGSIENGGMLWLARG